MLGKETRGRKKIADENIKYNKHIVVCVNNSMMQMIDDLCYKNKFKRSDYIRLLIEKDLGFDNKPS